MVNSKREKFRKRRVGKPSDKGPLSSRLREISGLISRRRHAEALAATDKLLSMSSLAAHDQARVLALVGDSEFKRGCFRSAAAIYLRAATRCMSHPNLWLRPLVGHVRALLKDARVSAAERMALHAVEVARQKRAQFDTIVRHANRRVAGGESVPVPALPPRVSVVATRMGYLFLNEGELATAKKLFEEAVDANRHGACRAREGLARVALAMDAPAEALRRAGEAIRMGGGTGPKPSPPGRY